MITEWILVCVICMLVVCGMVPVKVMLWMEARKIMLLVVRIHVVFRMILMCIVRWVIA